jgi:hypothetical protein
VHWNPLENEDNMHLTHILINYGQKKSINDEQDLDLY